MTIYAGGSFRQIFGSVRAAAGRVKKRVAKRLQKIPMAQAMPRPLKEGFLAQPSEANPLMAVSPANNTGLTTPATSCSRSCAFCQIKTM